MDDRQEPAVRRIDSVVAGEQQLARRVQQEGPEDEQHPFEPGDQRDAGEDEPGAQHQRTEHAPEQHPALVGAGTWK